MGKIRTGKGGGLASNIGWATLDGYRLVVYAQGGYSLQRHVEGIGWCLFPLDESAPPDVERALCEALGIPCGLDTADEPWTVADILAREG